VDSAVKINAPVHPTIRYSIKALPEHGDTVTALAEKLLAAGHTILEVNEAENFVLLAQRTETDERWGCTLCFALGTVTLLDTLDEIRAHCDIEHSGWEEQGGTIE
jgi:hypothetical protein